MSRDNESKRGGSSNSDVYRNAMIRGAVIGVSMHDQLEIATAARPLGLSEDVSATDEQLRKLAALERFDLWFVEERLARKELLPQSLIPEAVAEFRRFIALVVLGHRGFGVSCPEVDEVWHALILFTLDYARFCELLGTGFIHHVPTTSRSPRQADDSESFAEVYSRHFGEPSRLLAGEFARNTCHPTCRSDLATQSCKNPCKACTVD